MRRTVAVAVAIAVAPVLVALSLSLLCASASATTVGGLSTAEAGPFALADGRLFLPELLTNNEGEAFPGPGAPPTEIEIELQSFAGGRHGTHTFSLDDSSSVPPASSPAGSATPAVARPAIAADGDRIAVAWEGAHGFQSALVVGGARSPSALVAVPSSGGVAAYNVAVDAAGARAVVWSDALGLRLQAISPAGVAAPVATLASTPSTLFTAGSDDAGGWWAVWSASGRLLAAHVSGEGAVAGTVDLGAVPSGRAAARALWSRPWTIVADGSGGIWVGLSRALLHVHPDGAVARHTLAHPAILAEGDRRSALLEALGPDHLAVRPLGRGAPSAHLSHLGAAIDIAFDASRQSTYVLSATVSGHMLLTKLDRRDRLVSTVLLAGCPRPGAGELVAGGGLLGVGCADKIFEAESVETGGDFERGRHVDYFLLKGRQRLHSVSLFEGVHAY